MNQYPNFAPESIEELSDEEARKALDDLATKAFNTKRWISDLSAATGLSKRTIIGWRSGRPPAWAIMFLQALCDTKECRHILGMFKEVISALERV